MIPIRPHKEAAALNWLQYVEGKDGIGPNDMYGGPDQEFQGMTVIDALKALAGQVDGKHDASLATKPYPNPSDPGNHVMSTPVDVVYEQGFDPLQNGFRIDPAGKQFEVFDQWIEILPTDQLVPVEVKYDPKTGRQV